MIGDDAVDSTAVEEEAVAGEGHAATRPAEPEPSPPEPAVIDADEFKPRGRELVVSDPRDENELFTVLDKHDEAQILDELQERVLDVTLYDFGEGRNRQVDLSYTGVREFVHLANHTGKCRIRVVPGSLEVGEISEDGTAYYQATVWAEDEVTGSSFSGTALEPKHMHKRNGDQVWDKFARTKAINKAERNALKKFIPEKIRQTLIAQYIGDPRRVKQIRAGAGAEQLAELPPPLTTPRANELRGLIEQKYDELKEFNRQAILPATYFSWLKRSEHSEEELEKFLKHLSDSVERERQAAAV